MRARCLLVAGSESHFMSRIMELATYLASIGCNVEVLESPVSFFHYLKKAIRETARDQPFFLAYVGHGNEFGWEDGVCYLRLAWNLRKVPGDLIVLNDTCYASSLVPYLERMRKPSNTSFLSNWDADEETFGGNAIQDALHYWPERLTVEDVVADHYYSPESGEEYEVPIQLRWGARLDHHFFPA